MFFLSNGLRALFIVFILFGCSDGDLKGSKEEQKEIYTQWNRAWEASDIKITASHL